MLDLFIAALTGASLVTWLWAFSEARAAAREDEDNA